MILPSYANSNSEGPSYTGSQNATIQASNVDASSAAGTSAPDGCDVSPFPSRYCSVKGCKALVPGDCFYKMCEPCRDRYRGYGITKRAKWKQERVTANATLDILREAEDKRRAEAGLSVIIVPSSHRVRY